MKWLSGFVFYLYEMNRLIIANQLFMCVILRQVMFINTQKPNAGGDNATKSFMSSVVSYASILRNFVYDAGLILR